MEHKLIHTENYLLVISDDEIKEGDYYLSKISNDVFRRSKDGHWIENYDKKMYHKVIAHLPLNNSPILEGIPLLPPLEQEIESNEFAYEYSKDYRCLATNEQEYCKHDIVSAFNNGYNKAKEKYKYTEEDMLVIRNQLVNMLPTEDVSAWDMIQSISKYTKWFDEYIESLSQPKLPIGFKCEVETKTTINSQGQEILVGKYIY